MVYDPQNLQGGTSVEDFEDCLCDFMLEEFHVEGDDDSIEQIAKIMMRVRKELCATAMGTQ